MMIESLITRIERGMTTVEDAKTVSRLIGRAMRYELVLKDIAAHGDAGAALKAARALQEFWIISVAADIQKEQE